MKLRYLLIASALVALTIAGFIPAETRAAAPERINWPHFQAINTPADLTPMALNNVPEVVGFRLHSDAQGQLKPFGVSYPLRGNQIDTANPRWEANFPSVLFATSSAGGKYIGQDKTNFVNFLLQPKDSDPILPYRITVMDVNDAGQTAGTDSVNFARTRVFRLNGRTASAEYAPENLIGSNANNVKIANNGLCCVTVFDQTTYAALWRADDSVTTLPGTNLLDLNPDGTLGAGVRNSRAVLWDGTNVRDLGIGGSSTARAVNNSAQVAGTQNRPNGGTGFLWQAGQTRALTDLSRLEPGWRVVDALDINDLGYVLAVLARGQTHKYAVLRPH